MIQYGIGGHLGDSVPDELVPMRDGDAVPVYGRDKGQPAGKPIKGLTDFAFKGQLPSALGIFMLFALNSSHNTYL